MTCPCQPTENADPGWLDAHHALLALHLRKSATYGQDSDRLANFTKLGEASDCPPERYAVLRIIEKALRALHQIDAGEAHLVHEYADLASLSLCAEALRKRPMAEVIPFAEAERRCCA